MKYEIGIIGGGPSGLFSGMNLKKPAIIFEKKDNCGNKLIITGSGKCNFTHSGSINDFIRKYGNHSGFVKNALKRFSNLDLLKYLDELSYEYEMREDGKYFPKSYSAFEFRDFLAENNISIGNEIKTDSEVIDIKMKDEKFVVSTKESKYEFRYLIIGTGGKSYPKTGSDGNVFPILKKLGHNIIQLKPALAPVYIKNFLFKDLMGISFEDILIENWRNGKKVFQDRGELLLTHFGLSGPIILDNSRFMENGDILKINFLNEYNRKSLEEYMLDYISKNSKSLVVNFIRTFNIQRRVSDKIIEISGILPDKKISELKKDERKNLIKNLIEFSCEIDKIGDYNIAMATAGGIDTAEVNSKTFESKIIKNLFIVGEALDIDGDTGGYNLQWAFTSSFLSSEEINKRLHGIDN